MCIVFSLIPATIVVTIAYFVLFSSSKVEGPIRKFGQALTVWLLIVALFYPILGTYVTLSGKCPIDWLMQRMEISIEK